MFNTTGDYTIPVAGKYKISLSGSSCGSVPSNGYWKYGGTITGTIYYNKGVSLTAKKVSGAGSAGAGVVLLAGGSLVLAAGGGGYCKKTSCYGGGGYIGGANWSSTYSPRPSGYSWDGTQGSYQGANKVGDGGSSYWQSGSQVYYGNGGAGYCRSSYTCTGTSNTSSSASISIIYCGPNSNSTCP